MENLAVNITNLQVSFGNQLELSIDSLRVYQQDRIGIIGENGVGKSTLLKLIAGELFPQSWENPNRDHLQLPASINLSR